MTTVATVQRWRASLLTHFVLYSLNNNAQQVVAIANIDAIDKDSLTRTWYDIVLVATRDTIEYH